MQQYLADPCSAPSLSAGIADILCRQSPAHARTAHPRLNPNYKAKEDSRFDIGTAAHSLVLEGDDKVCVVEFDDWKKKAAQEQRDQARANGLVPLLSKHYHAVKEMVGVAREFISQCEIAKHLVAADAELTCIAHTGSTWLRCRPDLLSANRGINVHYKTCENAEPGAFCRQIPRMGYDIAAVLYEDALKRLGFKSTSYFIAQEISPPYACSLSTLDAAARDIAEGKYEYALRLWEKCMAADRWNAYPLTAAEATPSSWEMADAEDRRLSMDDRLELATQG